MGKLTVIQDTIKFYIIVQIENPLHLETSDVLLLEEYSSLLLSSVPPNHVYYYKKYGKDFFDWIERLTK